MQSQSRQRERYFTPNLPGLAVALMLSILATACADREGSNTGTASQTAEPPAPGELFVTYCAACHGADGRGNGPLAAELKVAPTNLRLIKQSNNGEFPSREVRQSIDGRAMPRAHGLPDMPVWGKLWLREGMADAEVKARAIAITGYIASIQE